MTRGWLAFLIFSDPPTFSVNLFQHWTQNYRAKIHTHTYTHARTHAHTRSHAQKKKKCDKNGNSCLSWINLLKTQTLVTSTLKTLMTKGYKRKSHSLWITLSFSLSVCVSLSLSWYYLDERDRGRKKKAAEVPLKYHLCDGTFVISNLR